VLYAISMHVKIEEINTSTVPKVKRFSEGPSLRIPDCWYLISNITSP
jgi:hypothetical protein